MNSTSVNVSLEIRILQECCRQIAYPDYIRRKELYCYASLLDSYA